MKHDTIHRLNGDTQADNTLDSYLSRVVLAAHK